MSGPSRTPKKSPLDSGRKAADIDEGLPWDKVREPRKCNFTCDFYNDPLSCDLLGREVIFNAPCETTDFNFDRGMSLKERGH